MYLSGDEGPTVSMSGFRVEGMQYGNQTQTLGVTVTLRQGSGQEVASSDTISVVPLPNVIMMPGLRTVGPPRGIKEMAHIGSLIERNPLVAEAGGGVNVQMFDATDEVYGYVKLIADFNAQENTLHQPTSPIILVGYSDGATEVKEFAWKLKADYRDQTIGYVGMIDLVRLNASWWQNQWQALPDRGETVEMPDTILDGDNYYQRSDGALLGHRTTGCALIRNTLVEIYPAPRLVGLPVVVLDHLHMVEILYIQEAIAWNAAVVYTGAL